MIAMKFTIERGIGLSFLLQAALPQLVTDRETKTHRRGRSKRWYGRRCPLPGVCFQHDMEKNKRLASAVSETLESDVGVREGPDGTQRLTGRALPRQPPFEAVWMKRGIKRGGLRRYLGKRWNPRSSHHRLQTPS